MKKTIVKLLLSFAAFLAANLWIIGKGVSKGSAHYFISPVVEETMVFILLQIFVIAIYCVRPLAANKTKLAYWCVSETLVLATVFFWGIFIVGPIWLK